MGDRPNGGGQTIDKLPNFRLQSRRNFLYILHFLAKHRVFCEFASSKALQILALFEKFVDNMQ